MKMKLTAIGAWPISSMKNLNSNSQRFNLAALGLAFSLLANHAGAAVYYWDLQGTTGANPYTGSLSGTWENNDWSVSTSGQATPGAWVDIADGRTAEFAIHSGTGTPAFTVTMNANHTVAGIINNPPCTVTITGSGTMTLPFGSQLFNIISVSGDPGSVTINNVINGTGSLSKFGTGTLTLSGANTYSGGTTLNGPGTLQLGDGLANNGSVVGNITNLGTLVFANPTGQIYAGVISGTGSLTKQAAGILTLTGANTYSSGTTINGGVVQINADGSLGSVPGTPRVNVSLNGACLMNDASSPVLNGNRMIQLGTSGGYFDAGWGPGEPLTINGQITGTGRLYINLDGSPVVLANPTNNYTGDTIIGTNGPGSLFLGHGGLAAAWGRICSPCGCGLWQRHHLQQVYGPVGS